jgi:hypothetical protein
LIGLNLADCVVSLSRSPIAYELCVSDKSVRGFNGCLVSELALDGLSEAVFTLMNSQALIDKKMFCMVRKAPINIELHLLYQRIWFTHAQLAELQVKLSGILREMQSPVSETEVFTDQLSATCAAKNLTLWLVSRWLHRYTWPSFKDRSHHGRRGTGFESLKNVSVR